MQKVQYDWTGRCDDMRALHPKCRAQFYKLEERLKGSYARGETKTLFLPFETYRTPQRQDMLLKQGTSTKAGAWQSTHQYGLAVDFVPWDVASSCWNWHSDADWRHLDELAKGCGLVRPISWDRPHIEARGASMMVKEAAKLILAAHVDPFTGEVVVPA